VSRSVTVPDFGDSGSLYQQVEIAEPGEPGYPTPELPDSDPWAPAVNAAIREVTAEADLAYWEEAHAAFHRCAAEDARIWIEPEPEPEAEM
jgi:hypothetical protein